MQGHLAMQDLTLTSVLTASKPNFIPSLTKVIGTLGPNSRSVEVIESCLKAGMSVARFDFTWSNGDYHQETLENLTKAVKKCTKTCAVMVDTIGPELQVCNKSGNPVELKSDSYVTITSDLSKGLSADILPINYAGLAKAVKKGDTIFLGQYLFSGHETTSAWLEVHEIKGEDVVCLVKNSATLDGSLFTLHVSQVHIDMPTLTETDKQIISTWATKNKADFISLSYTRHAEDIRELRDLLKKNNLQETKILAKIETVEGLNHFNEILHESDGIILCRGKLGIDLPPEKVFVFQKAALNKCNLAGKPAIVTRVLDSLTGNLRPTRAEATDVANAVLDGADSIMLGAETLRGLYPVEAIKTVGNICAEAEKVYNQAFHFKKIIRHVGEPMSYAEAVASSAVRVAAKVKAAIIVVFTSSGGAARLIAKYRPATPVVAVVIPRLRTEVKNWTFVGSVQVRQLLGVRGVYPILGSPEGSSKGKPEEYALKLALDHGKSVGLVKAGDQIVIFQKIEDSSVVKIIE